MKDWTKSAASWVSMAAFGLSCGGQTHAAATSSPSANVAYGFAGLTGQDRSDEIQRLRATITWTVAPRSTTAYSVSTWIAFAAPSGTSDASPPGSAGVSYRIVQIGWIQKAPNDYRLFWEWDNSQSDHHLRIGDKVDLGRPLQVEIDRDRGGFTLAANGVQQDSVRVAWTPTVLGTFAETHDPNDYLPGSSAQPEVISDFQEEISGQWRPYEGDVFSSADQYRTKVMPDNSILIWDTRQ